MLDAAEGIAEQDLAIIARGTGGRSRLGHRRQQVGRPRALGPRATPGRARPPIALRALCQARVHLGPAWLGPRRALGGGRSRHDSATRALPTAELNRILERAYAAFQPPMVGGRTPKLRYAHQGGRRPPCIVVHGSRVATLGASHRRYLENVFRERHQPRGHAHPPPDSSEDGIPMRAARHPGRTAPRRRARAQLLAGRSGTSGGEDCASAGLKGLRSP